jgi:predicted PurR-regulated permease PerM
MALPRSDVDASTAAWFVVGLCLLVALLFVLQSFVGTFVFGVFFYYATRPVYRRIQRYVGPPSLAAAVAIFALALPALLLVSYALLVVVRELDRLTDEQTFDPSQYPLVGDVLNEVGIPDPEALLSGDLLSYVSPDQLGSVLDSLGSAVDTLAFLGVLAVHLFLMIAIAFYLLKDDHKLASWSARTFGRDGGVFVRFARAVDDDLNSIFFGNILNAVVTGTIGVIVYSVLNVAAPSAVSIPAAALIGLLAGVASLIPVVGMKLVYVPVAAYMLLELALASSTDQLWFVVAFAAASFVVVDTIPDLVLRPYVSGRSLHVGAVMVAYTLGPLLFGWYGIFLMPMLLVFVVQFARVVLPNLLGRSDWTPAGVDPIYLDPGAAPGPAGPDGVPDPVWSPPSLVDAARPATGPGGTPSPADPGGDGRPGTGADGGTRTVPDDDVADVDGDRAGSTPDAPAGRDAPFRGDPDVDG